MAKPKIFVSSTYYDLKHIRSSLKSFIETLGYDAVLSEDGGIAYTHEKPLRESCFDEIDNVDILVLIIGGRYGTNPNDPEKTNTDFLTKYESVTKQEFETAVKQDIPVYIFIENSVSNEYETYKINKDNDVNYATVDSINIFKFIDQIKKLDRNNQTQSFENHEDIEKWLKSQWAGKFQSLLQNKKKEKEISHLSDQIEYLEDITKTLKIYLEDIISREPNKKKNTVDIVETENQRLKKSAIKKDLEKNKFYNFINCNVPMNIKEFTNLLETSQTAEEFLRDFNAFCNDKKFTSHFQAKSGLDFTSEFADINEARKTLGLPKYDYKFNFE